MNENNKRNKQTGLTVSTLASQTNSAKGKRKETATQRKRRLEKEKRKRQEKLANETEEEKRLRLDKRNQRLRNASQEQRERLQFYDRQRHALSRTNETQEQRELRLLADCQRHALSRIKQRKLRLQGQRRRQALTIENEMQEQRETGLQDLCRRQALSIENETQEQREANIGLLSQHATYTDFVPVIKTEIPDPSEQNQEFVLPDYLQHVTTMDPVWAVKTEIQDSSKINNLLLPNIKVEQAEIDNALDKSPKTGDFSESFIYSEVENSLTFNHKLTECSVLLQDCLVPENLISISAKFKSLRINTDISKTIPKLNLFLLNDTPFLPHISEAYKKMAFTRACEKMKSSKKSKPNHKVRPNPTKKKKSHSERSKYICNCFKAAEDAISMESQFYESYSESTQQLCSCLTSDNMLSESTEILMKKTTIFDPYFGKITCGVNR